MKREIALKWAEALESGKYAQGKGLLCRIKPDGSEEYCCLGVLCELAIEAGVDISAINYDSAFRSYAGNHVTLPLAVSEWAGLGTIPNPYIAPGMSASHANDFSEHSFPEIAKLIRARWVA